MDDWLITPAINFTAGKTYRFTIPQFLHPAMTLTIANGREATAEAMTGTILADKALQSTTDWDLLTVDFQVEATGAYHIGLHAINSERVSRGLYIRNTFTIEEISGDNVPNAPTQLTATGGSQGAKTVHISCVAPTKTVKGDDITSPLTISVFYRNRVVAAMENVTAGQTVEIDYADEFMADGTSHLVGERIQMQRLKGDDEWRTAMADLSEYKAEEYVMVKFVLTAGRRNETVKLNAISIYNMLQYNLALTLTVPAKLKAGTEGPVSITVRNTGDNPSSTSSPPPTTRCPTALPLPPICWQR